MKDGPFPELEAKRARIEAEGGYHATLRDQFALAALTGLLANAAMGTWGWETFAKESYDLADCMLKARAK